MTYLGDGLYLMNREEQTMKLEIGKNYLVRTNTRDDWVGRLVEVDGPYTVTLEDFAWIANSGRYHEFLRDGRSDNMEIEPGPDGMKKRLHYSDITEWPHALLRKAV